jgi:hypothetical protein
MQDISSYTLKTNHVFRVYTTYIFAAILYSKFMKNLLLLFPMSIFSLLH